MSTEPNWLDFFEDRERLYAAYYLDFAEQNARRDPEAYEQLEAESGNLLRVADWLGEHDEAEGILKLAGALWEESDFMRTRGFMQRGLPLLERAREVARGLGDSRAQVIWLEALADIHLSTGKPITAQPLFEQALALAQDNGDPLLIARSQLDLGRFFMEMEDLDRAVVRLKQALQIYHQIQDYEGEIETLVALGNLLSIQGDSRGAVSYIEQGFPLVRMQQDRHGEVTLQFALGYVGTATKDWPLAIKHYEPVIDMARRIGDRFIEIRGLTNLGEAWLELGDVQRAKSLLEEALALQEMSDDVLTKAFTHLYLAKAHNILNDPNESLAHLEHVYPLSQVPVLFHEAAEAAWVKADNYLKKGHIGPAVSALNEVLDLAPHHMVNLRQSAEALLEMIEMGDVYKIPTI